MKKSNAKTIKKEDGILLNLLNTMYQENKKEELFKNK
jgi:hypothetical protein